MIEKYIQALQTIEKPSVTSLDELKSWQARAINVITRIYGENSKQEEQIKEIKFRSYVSFGTSRGVSGGGNNGKNCEKHANEIIKGFIADLETFGIPQPKQRENNSAINISVNQNQNQTVHVNIIWESIKDELTDRQLKEIEEIINDNEEQNSKKTRIFEKLKSFGGDVASNIIAGLLTNPAIYGG